MVKYSKNNHSLVKTYGYTHHDFKKWDKMGGRTPKYVSNSERQKAYQRRKVLAKLATA